jgi:hypothetical protein
VLGDMRSIIIRSSTDTSQQVTLTLYGPLLPNLEILPTHYGSEQSCLLAFCFVCAVLCCAVLSVHRCARI